MPALLALALVLVGVGPLAAPPAPARPPAVLVLVPDLVWEGAPPVLDGWAKASLSLRSDRPSSDAPDGYLTVGKGGRSSTPTPGGGVGPVVPVGGAGPGGGAAVRLADWSRLEDHDQSLRYSGKLGSLGQALNASGRPWALVSDDPAAAAAAVDRRGVVTRFVQGGASEVGQAVAGGANAVIVAAPAGDVLAVVGASGPACVIVASVSSPGQDSHLGVLAASPTCGLGWAGLSSPSTHQAHLATLLDVPVTFLSRLGIAPPPGMGGSVVRPSPAVSRSSLIERDRRAVAGDDVRGALTWIFVCLTAAGAAAALLWPPARPVVSWTLLAVPPASFLVMLVPWWRWGLVGVLVAGGAIAAAISLVGAIVGRRHRRLGVGVLAGLAAAVVGVDAVFGGGLEINAPFGNSPVGAGRFYGVGNVGSGFLMAGLIVAAGVALDHWGRRAAPACAGVLAAGVVVGGAPWFGADVGGVLASVPAYGTLLAAGRRRPPVRVVVGLVVATAAVLALFLAADLARPAADRTHLGRVITGGDLGAEMARKGGQALATVKSPLSLVVVIGVAALLAARVRLGGRPALMATAWALAVAAVVGSVLNDSGLIVATAVMAVGWPALLTLAAPPTDLSGEA